MSIETTPTEWSILHICLKTLLRIGLPTGCSTSECGDSYILPISLSRKPCSSPEEATIFHSPVLFIRKPPRHKPHQIYEEWKFNQRMKIIASWDYWRVTSQRAQGTKRKNEQDFEALTEEGAVFTGHKAGSYVLSLVSIKSEAIVFPRRENP